MRGAAGKYRLYPAVAPNGWVQPVKRNYGMACCDCGLVHRLDFRVKDGRAQFRARRDNRATAQLRRRPEYAKVREAITEP